MIFVASAATQTRSHPFAFQDPILPSSMYDRILEKMLLDVERISRTSKDSHSTSTTVGTDHGASDHFLDSLTAWGSTNVLKVFIKLYRRSRERYSSSDEIKKHLKEAEVSLQRRYLQTAAGYLNFPVQDPAEELQLSAPTYEGYKDDSQDFLFDVAKLVAVIAPRVPLVAVDEDTASASTNVVDNLHRAYTLAPNNLTCLEAMSRLRMMQGRYDLALKCFLAIGACHATQELGTFEKAAIDVVNGTGPEALVETPLFVGSQSYDYLLDFIGTHHLHQFLLEKGFILSTDSKLYVPLFALLQLVGLQRLGDFLIEHCVSPDFSYDWTLSDDSGATKGWKIGSDLRDVPRREPLPVNKVAEQLESSPALLHWYLHLVLTRRPDFYVRFPTNAVPSKAVTDLHRKHFQLYVDFARGFRNSREALAGTEPYKVESQSTPLLAFLKAALPVGGVLPVDARRALEIERTKSLNDTDVIESRGGDSKRDAQSEDSSSPIFALELAYVIETYNEQTETEAMGILNLYLRGIASVVLAVLYVQRQQRFSSVLWDTLTAFCRKDGDSQSHGMLYGELLEAAALSGADLARLVKDIPEGMNVEGLRPRLVAAVADYRMKLEVYIAAKAAGTEEEVSLLREIAHRSRRGVRYMLAASNGKSTAELLHQKLREDEGEIEEKICEEIPTAMPKSLKPKTRRDHHRFLYSIPRR